MNAEAVQLPSILIVEDSEDDFEATTRAFKRVEFSNPLYWCKSGSEALRFLKNETGYNEFDKTERPSLILLDLNMPGIDGRRTLQLIKEDDDLKRIPVVILTTSGSTQDITACYQDGANTYIQKPVSFEDLIEAVSGLKDYWFKIAYLPDNVSSASSAL